MEINRKMVALYQTAAVLFVLALTSLENGVTGQCVTNPDNLAVLEGTQDLFLPCAPNPTQVSWMGYPTSEELDSHKLNDETAVVTGQYQNAFRLDARGLWILRATIDEEQNMFSSAGIFIGEHGNATRLVGAKVVVVRDGPVCKFNVPSPGNGATVTLNCTASYADHSVHPIRPIFTLKVGDNIIFEDVIYPERVTQFIFVAWRAFEMAYNACAPIVVTLTFDRPTDIQYDFIATNKPTYSNSITIPASSTDCLREGKNIAVLEGTRNVLAGSSRAPQQLKRKVSPTNNQLEYFPISDFDKGTLPNMTQYYSQDKNGLTILEATAVAATDKITTAGIYVEEDHSKKVSGFKVIVVRGPPTCTKNVSDANPAKTGDTVKLTCTGLIADHSLYQINSRMTLKLNGVPRSTVTPAKTRRPDELLNVEANFIITYDSASSLSCDFSFDPPVSTAGYDYMASNAPDFSASCQF